MAATPSKTEDDVQVSLDLLHPLMADVERKLRRFCYLPSPQAYATVTVWIVATHVAALLRSAPGLVVTAPIGRSARSRLLSVVSALTRKPLIATPANTDRLDLYRSAAEAFDPATVFIDDAETIFTPRVRGSKKDLRTFVDSCHTRGLFAVRLSGGEELQAFALVCMVAGQRLPAEVEDRAVVLRIKDAREDQDLGWFRRRDVSELVTASDLLTMWADQNMGEILEFLEAWVDKPALDLPLRMKDNAAETWEPLFAIADLAGHDWLDRIVEAARTLDGQYQADKRRASFAERLLTDLGKSLSEDVWADYDGFIGTNDAVGLLLEDPQGHWRAAGLTSARLSRTIGALGLKSRRDTTGTRRGFQIGELRKVISENLDGSDGSDDSDARFSAAPCSGDVASQSTKGN